jgi:hypothetical protein
MRKYTVEYSRRETQNEKLDAAHDGLGKIFAFLCECDVDVFHFLAHCSNELGLGVSDIHSNRRHGHADNSHVTTVRFHGTTSIEELQAAARACPDCHYIERSIIDLEALLWETWNTRLRDQTKPIEKQQASHE